MMRRVSDVIKTQFIIRVLLTDNDAGTAVPAMQGTDVSAAHAKHRNVKHKDCISGKWRPTGSDVMMRRRGWDVIKADLFTCVIKTVHNAERDVVIIKERGVTIVYRK